MTESQRIARQEAEIEAWYEMLEEMTAVDYLALLGKWQRAPVAANDDLPVGANDNIDMGEAA